jgi:benzoyl-CoA 2,3-dioxygenase component A
MKTFKTLFLHFLQDMYYAEQQILKTLPKVIAATENSKLRASLEEHVGETRDQIVRLEKVFESLGEPVQGVTCEAILGLLQETEDVLKETGGKGPVQDAGIIACAQAIEHYEIARFMTLTRRGRGERTRRRGLEVFHDVRPPNGSVRGALTGGVDGGGAMRQHLIDPEICIRCNTCEKRCPTGAISHARNYVVDPDVCTFCMACVRPCPTGAIDAWFNVERPFGLAEQHGWTMLPALAAEVAGAIPDAFDDEAARIFEIAHADLRGPARPPASASKPRINAFTREAPARAVVTGNTRITSDASASDVHHIILDFGAEPFPYLEGQSVGLVPPGLDAAGRPHEMRLYSAASARDGERPNTNNLALTVNRVVTAAGPGAASNWLCDRALGEELEVVGPFGATFLMPDDPQADLLMICTGTGVSPFRGFTHRRRRVAPKGPGGSIFSSAPGRPRSCRISDRCNAICRPSCTGSWSTAERPGRSTNTSRTACSNATP